jgi:hypothetical protein
VAGEEDARRQRRKATAARGSPVMAAAARGRREPSGQVTSHCLCLLCFCFPLFLKTDRGLIALTYPNNRNKINMKKKGKNN